VTDARDADDAHALLAKLEPSLPRLLVRNKVDLVAAPARRTGKRGHEIWLSALTGEGVELLEDAVLDAAGAQPSMEGAFIARARHVHALLITQRHLESAHAHLYQAQPPLELFAEDLRSAQDALASIAGKFSSDDLLGEIFSRFCIGK
jgi:tRNA modification GTPase